MTAMSPMIPNPCAGIPDLSALKLSHGSHGSAFDGECCLLELANVLATCRVDLAERFGRPTQFEDDHESVSRVVRRFGITLNDRWLNSDGEPRGWWCPDDAEALLRPYALKVLGTRTTEADEEIRRYLCVDWAIRTAAPMWLDAVSQTDDANALRALSEITNRAQWDAARPMLRRIRDDAWTRRSAAWDRYREASRRRRSGAAEAEAAAAAAAAAAEAAVAEVAAAAAAEAAVAEAEAAVAAVAAVAAAAAEAAVAEVAAAAAAAEAAVAEVAAAAAAEAAVAAAAAEAAVAEVAAAAVARLRPTVSQVSRSALDLLDRLIAVGYENRRPEWRVTAVFAPEQIAGGHSE